jgi:hypothetical protein
LDLALTTHRHRRSPSRISVLQTESGERDFVNTLLRTKDDPVSGSGGRSEQNKMLVAGAVEVADGVVGRNRLARISDSSAKSPHGFVEDNIALGTTIKTDGWSAYPAD